MSGIVKRNVPKGADKKPLIPDLSDIDDSSDDDLPYGGRVFLAHKPRKDSWICIALQVLLVIAVFALAFYAYFYFEHMHVNVLKFYANLGYDTAQHELGNRYLHGVGVDKHEQKAVEWFQKAAEQGHPHAAYNLAIAHLKGIHNNITHDEAKNLIRHAAKNGVEEAKSTLINLCATGGCENDEKSDNNK